MTVRSISAVGTTAFLFRPASVDVMIGPFLGTTLTPIAAYAVSVLNSTGAAVIPAVTFQPEQLEPAPGIPGFGIASLLAPSITSVRG